MHQLPIENPVLATFACFFGASRATLPSTLSQLDFNLDLATQINPAWRFPTTNNPDPGLFMGCPLSNDRRELTRRCLFWCPQGLPVGRIASLCSSRLGKRLLNDQRIGDALRNFFLCLDHNAVVLTAKGVTLDLPLTRGCQLFHSEHLHFTPFPKTVTAAWIKKSLQPITQNKTLVWFDPCKMSADEIIFSISEEVKILHARKNGTIERLIKRFDNLEQGPTIWKLTESRQPRTSENLNTPNSKIVNWHLYSPRLENAQSQRSQLEPLLFPLGDWNENFLNHWTRHARHSWPDQSPLGRFDALFLNASQAVGPLATLNRILAQQKLLASGRLISNGRRVVCFTEVPLKEFPKRRIFRSHLSRWDFEPWGISIRKNVLQGRGARKVQYLSDVAENPNPLGESIFQVRNNRPERNDWSQEQEWRIEGDLDLRTLRPQDAVVFVPDHQSAAALAPISRWPITILNAKTVKYSKS